jgi:hypothetical protein
MGIKRYFFTEDNVITNAFKDNLITRGTGSNMGASDILEAFVIQGQTSASINAASAEQARILVKFDMEKVLSDISAGTVPSSSVSYYLKMFNAPHGETTPLSYSLDIHMLSRSWTEGRGLDMDNYTDKGVSNWISSSEGVAWSQTGSDYYTGAGYKTSYFFSGGLEDIDVNVDFAIDLWRSGENSNYGFVLKNTDTVISGTEGTYYTKKFFGRTSDFFLNRPYIEARWDSARKDNRGNFFLSSSLVSSGDNINTLYLYNNFRGALQDIPDLEGDGQTILVNVYSGSSGSPSGSALLLVNSSGGSVTNITGGLLVENGVNITGVYTCSFASTSSLDTLHDVWLSGSTQFFTGTFEPEDFNASQAIYDDEYVTSITNLNASYLKGTKESLRVFSRKKNWSPTIYTIASTAVEPEIIENAYYRLFRTIDGMEVIPYGTGSDSHTKLSYDVSGNYFDLDTSFLEEGYSYGIQFLYYSSGQYKEQPEVFKFRVDESNTR